MASMTEEEVEIWLTNTVGLGQYIAIFKENNIDGSVLVTLSDNDLKDLGIASLGHRRKIVSMAQGLGGGTKNLGGAKQNLGGGQTQGSRSSTVTKLIFDLYGPETAQIGKDIVWKMNITDQNSRPTTLDLAKSEVHVTGAEQYRLQVNPDGGNAYSFSFTPGRVGTYNIEFNYGGIQQWKRQMQATADAETAPLFRLTMEGRGLQGGLVDELVSFTIKALEPHSNNSKDIDGSKLSIKVDGPAPVSAELNGSGAQYSVSYTVQKSGDYFIDICFDGKSVLPQPAKVSFSAAADASQCFAESSPTAIVDQLFSFKIFARDATGNPVTGGGEPFKVNVSGPDSKSLSELSIENEGDVYVLSCVLHSPGSTYKFSIMLHDQHISNSPVEISCE